MQNTTWILTPLQPVPGRVDLRDSGRGYLFFVFTEHKVFPGEESSSLEGGTLPLPCTCCHAGPGEWPEGLKSKRVTMVLQRAGWRAVFWRSGLVSLVEIVAWKLGGVNRLSLDISWVQTIYFQSLFQNRMHIQNHKRSGRHQQLVTNCTEMTTKNNNNNNNII